MKHRTFVSFALAGSLVLTACASFLDSRPATLNFSSQANQVAVPVRIADRSLTFLVDTAVDPSVIDRAVAKDLGLERLAEEGAIEGVGSQATTAFPVSIPKFHVGSQKYGPLEALVIDMSRLSARFGGPLHGVLGYSLLRDHAVLIDYPTNSITFYAGAAPDEPKGCRHSHRFPLRFLSDEDKLILVPGFRIGGVELVAMLDTGSSNNLRVEEDAPAVAPIRNLLPKGAATTVVGARGTATQRVGVLKAAVTLGPFQVDETEVALVGGRNPAVPVNIGNRFLRTIGASLLVDMPSGRVGIYGGCN